MNKIGLIILSSVSISCTSKYQGSFQVIRAYRNNAPLCSKSLRFENSLLEIENIRKYENGSLIKYQGCASEGLYTEDFEKWNEYSLEDASLKNLSIYSYGNEIIYFDKEYQIKKKNKDTLFVETEKKGHYLIFVGNIPNDK